MPRKYEQPKSGKRKPRGLAAVLLAAEEYRLSIDAVWILKRLKAHVAGEIKMLPTQVMAAQILLKKCMPDLQQIDVAASVSKTVTVNVVSFADLKYDEEGNPIYGKADGESPQQTAH